LLRRRRTFWYQNPHIKVFYEVLLAKGRKPTMARLILARKIAAITMIVWKKEVRFDANYLKPQTA
jgi:hypothetical protein